jgi:hypothetical protein
MGSKIVYIRKSGAEIVAYEDQVTAGLWHIPPKATEVKPPSFNAETHTCKFIDEDWVVAVIPEPEPDIGLKEKDPDALPLTYADNRRAEYPSIGDQLDMQYHDQLDGTTTWKDAIAKVKADNPKK